MKVKQKPLSFSLHPDNHTYIEEVVAKEKLNNHRYNRSMYMDDLITHLRTKAAAKPKPKAKTGLAEFAASLPDNLDIVAWDKWIAFRRDAKFKKYKTDAAMKKLAKCNFDDQMKMVQQSIDNEYQGLFAVKGNSASGKTSGNLSACEDFING